MLFAEISVSLQSVKQTDMNKIRLILLLLIYAACAHAQDLMPAAGQQQEDFFDPMRDKDKEKYKFAVEYRLEAGYVQNNHRTRNKTYEDLFMHGFRAGATFDFMLPSRFSLQTGVLYTFTCGSTTQYWAPMNMEDYSSPDPQTGKAHSGDILHRLYEHQLTVPVRAYYNIHLWKKLNMFFYTGPQLHIGLALKDDMQADISQLTKQWMAANGQPCEPYDRYRDKELHRVCVQWGVGGGFEWDRYRLQAGYDFGLNNMVRNKLVANQHLWEWHWFVSACYRF